MDEDEQTIEEMVQAAHAYLERMAADTPLQHPPIGFVSNARNATSTSDRFQFWAPAEETNLGIGSIICHTSSVQPVVHTYAIVVETSGVTLGLEDFAIHAFECETRPPLTSIIPGKSSRRPIVTYLAKVLASTQRWQRPILSGPVYAVAASDLAAVHSKEPASWLDPAYQLTGFYEDTVGAFGIFAEELSRMLGPKQGHVIFSGLPGSGKTSLFLTLTIALYAHLRQLEERDPDAEDT